LKETLGNLVLARKVRWTNMRLGFGRNPWSVFEEVPGYSNLISTYDKFSVNMVIGLSWMLPMEANSVLMIG